MSRNTIHRCGVLLVLVLALGLAGATPASAAEEPGWNRVLGWLAGLFELQGRSAAEDGGTFAGLSRIWDMEGPGYDPNGNPIPGGEDGEEGPGYDPNGLH